MNTAVHSPSIPRTEDARFPPFERSQWFIQPDSIMRTKQTNTLAPRASLREQLKNVHWLVETTKSPMIEVRFTVPEETLPALYSAVEEISNEVGSRLEAPHRYAREDSLTFASRALASLRAGISNAHSELATRFPRDRRWQSPLGDKDYR